MFSQKTAKIIITGVVVAILGFLVIYSQTGLPKVREKPKAKAAGYGAAVSPMTPMIDYVKLPAMPGDEKIPEGANLPLLVQPSDLEEYLGKWILVDCRPKNLYDEGHIPTAIHLGETCNDFFRDDLNIKGIGVIKDLKLGQVEELEKKLSQAGISMEKTILFYDQREDPEDVRRDRFYGIFAGYAFVPFWYLEWLGHKDVRVLDGGIGAWVTAGKPIEKKENKLKPTTFKANVNERRLATVDEVLKIAKGEIKDIQLVDSRIPDEFLGKHQSPPKHFLEDKVRRAGRIPNTELNVPHFMQFVDPQTAKLRPIFQLKRLYASLDKDKRTVLYCYIANRISLSYFVLRYLGFKDPAIYHDSWITWGNDLSLPVEKEKRVRS
jgi:thiosulfate/3-mercaptopyruvate sulfurtransferase